MRDVFWLQIRDWPGLLAAMLDTLVDGAALSLEGQLSMIAAAFETIPGSSREETTELKRNTIAPLQDFVVLPLELETIEQIKTEILGCLNFKDDVIHVQIAKSGEHVFGAYDLDYPDLPNFVSASAVTEAMLKQWVSQKLLRGYELRQV